MTKWVYLFKEGNADMRNLLGGKGANLAEMTNLGLPIPQGFTVTTEACTDYYASGKVITDEIQGQIFEALSWLEKENGRTFGDTENPLLVSVRSGARASMPGMMDTILNLGLNDVSVEGFARKTGNPRFAYDSYRRFIQMFSDVVMEVPKSFFEKIIDEVKEAKIIDAEAVMATKDIKFRRDTPTANLGVDIVVEYMTDMNTIADEKWAQALADPDFTAEQAQEEIRAEWEGMDYEMVKEAFNEQAAEMGL